MTDLTTKSARALAKKIVSESNGITIAFGRTNGRIVLHLTVKGSNNLSRTIRSEAEWEDHDLNLRVNRNREFADAAPTEALMAANGS